MGEWWEVFFLYKNLNIGEYLNLLITFSGRWMKVLGEGCVLQGQLFLSTVYDRHLLFVSLLFVSLLG